MGNAGLSYYDIDMRERATDPWTVWQRTAVTSAVLYKDPGATVAFRSRGVDRAFNEETPPADPDGDTLTTFYRWSIQGPAA